MIQLTRLDGTPFLLNEELIETFEETPETVVRLADKRFVVRETAKEVWSEIIHYKRLIYSHPSARIPYCHHGNHVFDFIETEERTFIEDNEEPYPLDNIESEES